MIIKSDEAGRIDTIDAEGRLYLECMDDDQAYLALTHAGEYLLIDINAEVVDGKPLLTVTVAEPGRNDGKR